MFPLYFMSINNTVSFLTFPKTEIFSQQINFHTFFFLLNENPGHRFLNYRMLDEFSTFEIKQKNISKHSDHRSDVV